jgi:branched-chain amino acid transport system substrate-binding protein
MMDRRSFVKKSAALGGLALSGTLGNALAQQGAGPIKIGLLTPLTGVVAAGGKEIAEGFNFYWDQVGHKVAGREVKIFTEDDGSNPDVALQKARKLVEQEKVDFLIGDLLANTGLAVAEYVKGTGTPYFIPVIAADDLTQRKRIPNVIRVAGYTASQMPRPLAEWAYKKKGMRKIITISQDYAFGHEQCGGFAQVFTELGGTIVAQHWNPLNTQDFSPYLAQIQSANPDAVFAMETGADASRLIQQWANFGMKGKIPLLGAQNFTDQSVIRTLGSDADGIITSAHFAEGNTVASTKKFVADYDAAFKRLPSLYGFSHYSAAMWLAEAITAVKGNVSDRAAFLEAVRKVVLTNSPLGSAVSLDIYGNPIYDIYIRQVVKRPDGRYWNVPIDVYPKVSQFWTYKPEEFMKQPPYSRTFQGIKKS